MSSSLRIAACIMFAAATLWAQEETTQTPSQGAAQPAVKSAAHRTRSAQSAYEAKKKAQVPSIIQSELERSRAEAVRQPQSEAAQPAANPAPSRVSLWPIFLSVVIAACATAAIVYFLFLKKAALFSARTLIPGAKKAAAAASVSSAPAVAAAAPAPGAASAASAAAGIEADSGPFSDEDIVTSAAPYASEEENETPEAALTMNLINKKRETKKEVMQDVMRRVQRKEKPQEIAEELRVGIGEVHLAMTLEKLKK